MTYPGSRNKTLPFIAYGKQKASLVLVPLMMNDYGFVQHIGMLSKLLKKLQNSHAGIDSTTIINNEP